MDQYYQIAGHLFRVTGEDVEAMKHISGFAPFVADGLVETSSVVPEFTLRLLEEGREAHAFFTPGSDEEKSLYTFGFDDVHCSFSRISTKGYAFCMVTADKEALTMYSFPDRQECLITGHKSSRLLLFALWMAYGVMVAACHTVAVHASAIIFRNKVVLFLGESGTGKSTHTRLWREHIAGAELLNDDSPILTIIHGKPYVYGSPWSGKTPCYRPECAELVAAVRLSQAPYNRMRRLSALEALGAVYPSCPPALVRDDGLSGKICQLLSDTLSCIPVYHLDCLPDAEAARLSFETIFGTEK